jgi:hypothetical protein
MKVKDLLHELNYNHQPDDEIAVVWFDMEYATNGIADTLLTDKELVKQAWREIIDDVQETIDDHIDFTHTGPEIVEMLEEKITELLQKEESDKPCNNFTMTGAIDDLDNQEIDVCVHCNYHRLDHSQKEMN